ncbi:MAG: hypothetical protein ACXAEN_27165, partial [Candidatus Thorarchaeota archaeon]
AQQAEEAAQAAEEAVTQLAVAQTTRKTKTEIDQDIDQKVTQTKAGPRGVSEQEEKELRARAKELFEKGFVETFEQGLAKAHQEMQQSREPETAGRVAALQQASQGRPQVQEALNAMEQIEESGGADIGAIVIHFQVLMAMGLDDATLEGLFPKSLAALEAHVRKNK